LLISDPIVFIFRDGRKHAVREIKLKIMRMLVDLKGFIEFLEERVGLQQERFR
jgi:hypothetical protein